MKELLGQVCTGAGIRICPVPSGVEYHCREDEKYRYHFWMNYGESAAELSGIEGENLLTGETVSGKAEVKPMDILALREKKSLVNSPDPMYTVEK